MRIDDLVEPLGHEPTADHISKAIGLSYHPTRVITELNALGNLRWATAKENIADRARHGRTAMGELNGSSKLDRHCAKTIKRMKGMGFSAFEVSRLACVHPETVERIWSGETWRHA